MSQVKKAIEETSHKTGERGSFWVSSSQEKVAGRIVSKQKSSSIITKIFKSNGDKSKRGGQGIRSNVGSKK